MSSIPEREATMNHPVLTPAERATLREEALRRAHELRRQAIVDGWNTLFRLLRRLARPGAPPALPRLR
jgi:hypothetical protein